MIINRVVTDNENRELRIEAQLEGTEGMAEVLRLCNAIEDGRALRPAPNLTISLQPDACWQHGQQDCDDCPELRCGDQLWPLLREPGYKAICEPGATDAERLDAALLLCWRLRQRVDDLETDLSERDQELEVAKATAIATEVRVARTLETIDQLRRGGIPGPEESREIVSPHRLERP